MICQYCETTMSLEGQAEYCCDNCGATYDIQDMEWTSPVVPEVSEADPLSYQDVVDCITETMSELDGEQIAEIHNNICSRKIEYIEDSLWQYTGKDDNEV